MTTTPPDVDEPGGAAEPEVRVVVSHGDPIDAAEPKPPASELAIAIAAIVVTLVVGAIAFRYVVADDPNKVIQIIVAMLLGGVGVWALYWSFDRVISALPGRWSSSLRPVLFVAPALALLAFYLVYPAINTLVLSFRGARGAGFVGLDNYQRIFTERTYLIGIRNSIAWVIIVPAVCVLIGLLFATLADKLGRRSESTSKSLVFLPMAISMVAATVVFTFIYSFRPAGFGDQIGLLNAIKVGLGGDPVDWLAQKPWNNLYLMVILIWLQVGFSMVILSSAIKGVPDELLEAARIDGATEWQIFRKIIIPTIASTILVVWTTVLITVWKLFDIVWVTTGGRDDTQVVAQQMVQEFFTNRNDGMGAALAVLLFIAVTPVLVMNIKRFQAEEAIR